MSGQDFSEEQRRYLEGYQDFAKFGGVYVKPEDAAALADATQTGKLWAGVALPVGKLTCEQMRGLALKAGAHFYLKATGRYQADVY
jgi:hypothetical protein